MKYYEITHLISSELSEEECKNLQKKLISLIQDEGGVLKEKFYSTAEEMLIRKRLAYSIKKQDYAYFGVLNFQLNPGNLVNLEKKLKAENQILRYLLINKLPAKKILEKRRRELKFKKVTPSKEKKVELKEIEEKLEEILHESE